MAIRVSILHLHQLGEKRSVPDNLVGGNFIIPFFNKHDNLVFLVTLVNQFHAVPLSLKNKTTLLDCNMIAMGKKYLTPLSYNKHHHQHHHLDVVGEHVELGVVQFCRLLFDSLQGNNC